MAGLSQRLVKRKGSPTALRKNTSWTDGNRTLISFAMADMMAKQSDEINIYRIPFLLEKNVGVSLNMM
jgi:hypothetical protein